MNGSNRRVFMLQVAAASGTALMAAKAQAQAAMVNEKDAQAAALGYVAGALVGCLCASGVRAKPKGPQSPSPIKCMPTLEPI